MNAGYCVHPDVLRSTSRICAALEIIPHIIGPKEVWATWMRDELSAELMAIPSATVDSPHPKLLGRLAHVLYRHYTHGMTLDTLDFDEVLSNDQLISGEEYIEIPLDELPDPTGSDLWWKVLPPSVFLRVNPPPLSPPSMDSLALDESLSNACMPASSSGPLLAPGLGSSGPPSNPTQKGKKKRVTIDDGPLEPRKKKRLDSGKVNNTKAGPSTVSSMKGKGKEVSSTNPDNSRATKVCEQCRAQELPCKWPVHPVSLIEKYACTTCASSNLQCTVAGALTIRLPPLKTADPPPSPPAENMDSLTRRVDEITKRVVELEKKLAANTEEKHRLAIRMATLELRLSD